MISDSTSAQVWVICTPSKPKILGRMSIHGMKNIPLRADEVIEALSPLPMDWSIILVIITVASSGRTADWHLSATFPTSTTASSLRNHLTTSGAKAKHNAPTKNKNIVPHLTQK